MLSTRQWQPFFSQLTFDNRASNPRCEILDKYCAGFGQILATTLDKYSEDIATWCQQTSQWQPILTVIWQPWMQVEVSASTLCVWWPTLDKWNVVRILDKYCKDIANIVMTKHAYNVFYQLAKSDRSCLHLHTFNMDLCVTWIEIKYRGKEMCYPILPCLWVPPVWWILQHWFWETDFYSIESN